MNSTVRMRRSAADPLIPCTASASQANRPEGRGRCGGSDGLLLLLLLLLSAAPPLLPPLPLPLVALLLGSTGRIGTVPLPLLLLLLCAASPAPVLLPLAAASGGAARLLQLLLTSGRFHCDAPSAGDVAASPERRPGKWLRGWV